MMRYQVILEYDRETGHWTATVAGIPHLIADAPSEAEALQLIEQAIRFAREEGDLPVDATNTPVDARLVAVDV